MNEPATIGSRFEGFSSFGPWRSTRLVCRVTEWEPERHYRYEVIEGPIRADALWGVRPDGNATYFFGAGDIVGQSWSTRLHLPLAKPVFMRESTARDAPSEGDFRNPPLSRRCNRGVGHQHARRRGRRVSRRPSVPSIQVEPSQLLGHPVSITRRPRTEQVLLLPLPAPPDRHGSRRGDRSRSPGSVRQDYARSRPRITP